VATLSSSGRSWTTTVAVAAERIIDFLQAAA
jgi:hypothetical protein